MPDSRARFEPPALPDDTFRRIKDFLPNAVDGKGFSCIYWDDSLGHDLGVALGEDDVDFWDFMIDEVGMPAPEGIWSPVFWGHGYTWDLTLLQRFSVLHFAEVLRTKTYLIPGCSERDIRVEYLIRLVSQLARKRNVRLRDRLWHDLRLDADQAAALFHHLKTRFCLPTLGDEWAAYLPDQRSIRRLARKKHDPPPLSVADLIPYCLTGQWATPGTADGLLVAFILPHEL
ncbi:MAG: hypothetical protein AAGH45_12055 [Pseudomonadota bacterium]